MVSKGGVSRIKLVLDDGNNVREDVNLDDVFTVLQCRMIMDDPERKKKVLKDMEALSRKLKRVVGQIKESNG